MLARCLEVENFNNYGNIQDQAGQGSEQPDLAEDVPTFCRGIGLDGF